ncbi:MAG: ACP S-malonyltransferase [Capsulimonadales bacterium]|nr:ACP S-malonyltransferase [Capsulimonadales bacterium]
MIAFIFPGQGAQAVGMGRDLYERSAAARQAFDVISGACGYSVSGLCFDGPEELLKQTEYTQPALFATECAALAACREAGLTPMAVAGHSVGEYAALVAAGVLTSEAGARLVKARAAAMGHAAQAQSGTMAAILGLDADVVAELCAATPGIVVPANDNCPGQVVISGETAAVEAVSVRLKERGAKRVMPLAVSGAFHSPLMQAAAESLANTLESTTVRAPEIPVVANVTADYEGTADEIRRNLAAQVAGPVRWTETIRRLTSDGYTTFIECGPGSVLAGLVKRIAPEAKTYSVGDMTTLEAAVNALRT